jgi:hypothetical protein
MGLACGFRVVSAPGIPEKTPPATLALRLPLPTADEAYVPVDGGCMLYGFIGRVSAAGQLKEGLDLGVQRTRLIADRVTRASLQNADGFAVALDAAQPGSSGDGPIDVEAEMVSLADEQLRFEATARLLEKTYQRIRTSLKSQ